MTPPFLIQMLRNKKGQGVQVDYFRQIPSNSCTLNSSLEIRASNSNTQLPLPVAPSVTLNKHLAVLAVQPYSFCTF